MERRRLEWRLGQRLQKEDKSRTWEGPVSYYKPFAAVKLEEEVEQEPPAAQVEKEP